MSSPIDDEASRLIDSGALGRSPAYRRLLEYLVAASRENRVPREIEVAADVFERPDFDPSSDSTVRVYVHKLREKLEKYYEQHPETGRSRLVIPKGKYQLELVAADQPAAGIGFSSISRPARLALLAAAGALTVAAFLLGRAVPVSDEAGPSIFASAPVWQAVLDDTIPVVVVVGDYFLFAEGNETVPGNRLIRDFAINSSADFHAWLERNPDLSGDYMDIHLSYLPVGTAAALNGVLRVLHAEGKRVQVMPQSRFRVSMMRESHVIYVGYISGIGDLGQFAFDGSRLFVGASFDELIDSRTGESYVSTAGLVTDAHSDYADFSFLTTFPGPSGNQFLFVTGMRDEGLTWLADSLADPGAVLEIAPPEPGGDAPAFETLYRVGSVDRTHVTATRLFSSPVAAAGMWQRLGGN